MLERARSLGLPQLAITTMQQTIVVLGRGSKPAVELELDNCLADSVPLMRRRGGGCAVVLDPGNVVVSVALSTSGFGRNREWMTHLCNWLTGGLVAVGVEGVEMAGISDLAIDDRKVSGACIHRSRDLLYFSATLLVDPDVQAMERYLSHPPREPDYRRGRSHADFCGRISAPGISDARALAAALKRRLATPPLPAELC